MEIRQDLVFHFLVCLLLAIFVGSMLMLMQAPPVAIGTISAFTALSVGFVKEWTDKAHGCEFDWSDFLADVIGTAIGSIMVTLGAIW